MEVKIKQKQIIQTINYNTTNNNGNNNTLYYNMVHLFFIGFWF